MENTSYKLQPGGTGYELVYGITAIPEYLKSLAPEGTIAGGFARIAQHEQTLVTPLLEYLKGKADRGVRVVGDETPSLSRAPTISFVVVGQQPIKSREVVHAFDLKGNVSSIDSS